jgi:SET domain-containing protein
VTTYLPETWFDPRVMIAPSPIHGSGMFTTAPIRAGETVLVWGGTLYTRNDLEAGLVPHGTSYSFVQEDRLLVAPGDGMDYFINHSCDPTVWMVGEVTVVARRDLAAGEEITGDYMVWESDPAFIIDPCTCGAEVCRGRITGEDWRLPVLQDRYAGHVLPYIARRFSNH